MHPATIKKNERREALMGQFKEHIQKYDITSKDIEAVLTLQQQIYPKEVMKTIRIDDFFNSEKVFGKEYEIRSSIFFWLFVYLFLFTLQVKVVDILNRNIEQKYIMLISLIQTLVGNYGMKLYFYKLSPEIKSILSERASLKYGLEELLTKANRKDLEKRYKEHISSKPQYTSTLSLINLATLRPKTKVVASKDGYV